MKELRRIAVVGSRDYARLDLVRQYVYEQERTAVILSGGARGVDTVAVRASCGMRRSYSAAPKSSPSGTDRAPARATRSWRPAGSRSGSSAQTAPSRPAIGKACAEHLPPADGERPQGEMAMSGIGD